MIYDNHHVLTAWHVVDCSPLDIAVANPDVKPVSVSLYRAAPSADIAVLSLSKPLTGFPRLSVSRPPPTGGICLVPSYPTRGRRCGVTDQLRPSYNAGDVEHTAVTERGNSGAGVYAGNKLVGLATHLRLCYGGALPCGGRYSSLWRNRWVLP